MGVGGSGGFRSGCVFELVEVGVIEGSGVCCLWCWWLMLVLGIDEDVM